MRSMWEWARASEAPHDGADRGDRQRQSVLRVPCVRPRGAADLLRYAGAEGGVREREAGDGGAGAPAEIEGGAQHPDPPDPDRPAHRPEDPRTVRDTRSAGPGTTRPACSCSTDRKSVVEGKS